jgi:hypothetical protein
MNTLLTVLIIFFILSGMVTAFKLSMYRGQKSLVEALPSYWARKFKNHE